MGILAKQRQYRLEVLSEVAMFARERVLEIYPGAMIIEHEPWDMDMREHWGISWPDQDLISWLDGTAQTRELAWVKAWEHIQENMLEKLEE